MVLTTVYAINSVINSKVSVFFVDKIHFRKQNTRKMKKMMQMNIIAIFEDIVKKMDCPICYEIEDTKNRFYSIVVQSFDMLYVLQSTSRAFISCFK